ncbi:hypothetical protein COEREDRAFT_12014 [Coemansia reversa NRRL 1564]|uniref:Uncharacterized protein n=1 Tax=Coemansia reversa (strain ATCC 12441 / NRRL 1564) TaxID=763665 RepID=A0A2G5B1L3_COERN|nr:hypothetical protein COEREDRAFT_12014 [Coemansia reversa NRRL 1564]|eukprot:PIA12903.1 hypothetical protein COEREDRAFT_12014 [Coemansia reversa NRRL 1564]
MTWKHDNCASRLAETQKREQELSKSNQTLQEHNTQAQIIYNSLFTISNTAAAYAHNCTEQAIEAQNNSKQALGQLASIKSELEAERKKINLPKQQKIGSAFSKVTNNDVNESNIIDNSNPSTSVKQFGRQ